MIRDGDRAEREKVGEGRKRKVTGGINYIFQTQTRWYIKFVISPKLSRRMLDGAACDVSLLLHKLAGVRSVKLIIRAFAIN